MSVQHAFDSKIDTWNKDQSSPWGRLRYTVGLANLGEWLGERPLTILDLGGGNGYDAIPLAKMGHQVTVIDFAEAMIENGRFRADTAGVASHITFIQGDATNFAPHVEGKTFDVILCHNLLQYVPKPLPMLKSIYDHLADDGLFSLIITNPNSDTFTQALRNLDFDAAIEITGKKEAEVATYKVTIQRYDDSELRTMLKATGFAVQNQYGIRTVCDYVADNDIKYDPVEYKKLEALELLLRDKRPFIQLARFYHFIAKPSKRKERASDK